MATRPPQTKEEFFLYAKACRFPCESCKGTGKDLSPSAYGNVPCQRCNGEGKTGMHFGRTAVCPGHSAPLDVFWDMYSQRFRHAFIRANRAGGKTKGIAFTEHMMMHHRQFTIAHMGGSEAQANRGRDYFHAEVSVEPWSDAVSTSEPGQTKVQFRNGGKIEWLPSTEKQASGPHPELSILDEMDECLAGDTLVSVCHDRSIYPRGMRLEELVSKVQSGEQIYAHSWSILEQRFIPNRILYAQCSGKREVFRISYRWRQAKAGISKKGGRTWHYGEICATADHKILLQDGKTWKKVKDLQVADSLMPFYELSRMYASVSLKPGVEIAEHRMVAEQIVGRALLPWPKEIAHHCNGNSLDNRPENIEVVTSDAHNKHHHIGAKRPLSVSESNSRRGSAFFRAMIQKRIESVSAEQMSRWSKERWADPEISQRMRNGMRRAWIQRRARSQELKVRLLEKEIGKEALASNHEVISIESIGTELVYDITVDKTHTFIANGIVVSNCAYEVRERFVKTPSGPRAMMIEASTWYGQEGTISRVRKENPGLVERVFCLWETVQRCEYSCDQMPLKDGSIGRCPLYEMEEMQADGSLKVVELCGGKLARQSDGHISIPDAVANWERSNLQSRRVEHLCQEPTIPSSILAYWAYSSQFSPLGNILPFDPPIRHDVPIHWTLDFNINPMSSFIIQPAPPEYPDEWWIVDEFYIFTVSTEWICQEFISRYGIGGLRLSQEAKETGIIGGLEVYGDWTGHNRSGTNLKSHYSIIQEMLKHTPNFRIMVQSTDMAAPVERLNLTNQMFFDLKSGSKRRFLKVAPRCVNGVREFGIMPRRAGTFEKDKSDRVQQQLGLSHLGDALECWVWKKFPYGPCPGPMPNPGTSGQRQSAGANQFIGGQRATGSRSPWGSQEDQGPWR